MFSTWRRLKLFQVEYPCQDFFFRWKRVRQGLVPTLDATIRQLVKFHNLLVISFFLKTTNLFLRSKVIKQLFSCERNCFSTAQMIVCWTEEISATGRHCTSKPLLFSNECTLIWRRLDSWQYCKRENKICRSETQLRRTHDEGRNSH